MVSYTTQVGVGRTHYSGLRALLAAASPARSGDELAGLGAQTQVERVAAQRTLADVSLTDFLSDAVIPYEDDDVTRLILDSHDLTAFSPLSGLTVGGLREWLLADGTNAAALSSASVGLTPEMVAAASKLMRNSDLITVSRKAEVRTAFRGSIGVPGRLATRLQPNHPVDNPSGVAAAVVDGLLSGCGDAVIGVNPASDSPLAIRELLYLLDEVIKRYAIPTQSCVLCHVTTTIDLVERGAPVDLIFQSVAGTQRANESFGVSLPMLAEARQGALELDRGTVGHNVMYFETGQGSALSADAHHGVDQQTCEARAYAVARAFEPLLVNSVVGFIGPEYLADGKQVLRAGLEDLFCGKVLGLPMGLDVCYTNHAEVDADDLDTMLSVLALAGAAFIITAPGGDDIMLNYQSASFEDALFLRRVLGLGPTPEFASWLAALHLIDDSGLPRASVVDRSRIASVLSTASDHGKDPAR